MKRLLFSLAFLSLTSLAFAQKTSDFSILPSLVKEAKEEGNVRLADSLAQSYINNYLFKLKKEELYTEENLRFIGDFLGNEESQAFKLFRNEPEKVNAVLGDYWAQKKVMAFINKNYLPKGDYDSIPKPDWPALEKVVVEKFGTLGQEISYGQRAIYYLMNKDWKNYGIYYQKYFEKGLKHNMYHVNNLSWALFEHVEDPKILKFACDVVMKYAMEQWYQNDFAAYDTYANLLYKIGKKNEAIDWEEKAVKLSNNDKTILDTLEKMKNSQKTWPETVNNR